MAEYLESRVEKFRRIAAEAAERRERVRQQAAAATREKGLRLEAEYEARLANKAKRKAKTEAFNTFLLESWAEREERRLWKKEALREWRNRPRIPLSTDPEVIRKFIVDDLTSRGHQVPGNYTTPNQSNRFIDLVVMMNRYEISEREHRATAQQQQQQEQ